MKKGIHPEYGPCTVRCTCGNTWVTRSTVSELTVDLCDKCHPFYTGQQKLVDTGGRVQRFSDKFGGAAAAQLEKAKAAKLEREKKAAEAVVVRGLYFCCKGGGGRLPGGTPQHQLEVRASARRRPYTSLRCERLSGLGPSWAGLGRSGSCGVASPGIVQPALRSCAILTRRSASSALSCR